jgi:hypothetical protein
VQKNAYRTIAATFTDGALRIQSYRKEAVQGFSCSLKQQTSRRGTIKLPSTPVCCGLNFELIFKQDREMVGGGVRLPFLTRSRQELEDELRKDEAV